MRLSFWQSILYDFAIFLLGLIYLPRLLWKIFYHGHTSLSLSQRLGFSIPTLPNDASHLTLWVHAVSLGEMRSVAPLIERIKKRYPHMRLVVTTMTQTGYKEAKRLYPYAKQFFLPFDLKWIISPIVKKIAPQIVVTVETDLWLNFLEATHECGAKNILVSGKLSERSFDRLKKFPTFKNALLSQVDLFLMQNEAYGERFHDLGVPQEKIHITGNLKYDARYAFKTSDERINFRKEIKIEDKDLVIVIGSTHAPEEDEFLKEIKPLFNTFRNLKLILVPRHPERFEEVAQIIKRHQIPFFRYSDRFDKNSAGSVILMDQMGVLCGSYEISDLAIVAGSYSSGVGGHNILEPCAYGKPVLFGPDMHTQEEMTRLVLKDGAGLQVPMEQLNATLTSLLENTHERERMGQAGLHLIKRLQGAADRTLDAITPVMQ